MQRPDLEQMQARCDAATEGPWRHVQSDNVIVTDEVGMFLEWQARSLNVSVAERDANATHIASARTDLPAAIAWALELERKLTEQHRASVLSLGQLCCMCLICSAYRTRNR